MLLTAAAQDFDRRKHEVGMDIWVRSPMRVARVSVRDRLRCDVIYVGKSEAERIVKVERKYDDAELVAGAKRW